MTNQTYLPESTMLSRALYGHPDDIVLSLESSHVTEYAIFAFVCTSLRAVSQALLSSDCELSSQTNPGCHRLSV